MARLRALFTWLALFAMTGCFPYTRRDFDPADHACEYNVPVRFGAVGSAIRFQITGWAQPERDFSWTEGEAASLLLELPSNAKALSVRFTLAALTKPPQLPAQRVKVYINGVAVSEWHVASKQLFEAAVPQRFVRAGAFLAIDFVVPDATAPSDLGLSRDTRRLGLQCFDFTLAKLQR